MRRSDAHAALYLQQRLILGWLRRAVRSVFTWILAAVIGMLLLGQVASLIQGAADDGGRTFLSDTYRSAIAAVAIIGGLVVGLWRGTSATPVASLADVVVLMGSPISSRLQFAYLMARPAVVNALVFGFWVLVASGGAVAQVSDQWIIVRIFTGVVLLILLAEFLRFAVWVSTEQVVARSPLLGQRLRTGIRALTIGLAAVVCVRLLGPVLTGDLDGWREVLDLVTDRADQLAGYPPMSLMAGLLVQGGATVASAAGLVAICGAIAGVALISARDFIEPVSMTAERTTDPRGHVTESGGDIQWATLSQFGVAPRMKASLPPFATGAWAILWAGTVRWVRYQLAAAWITLALVGLFGIAAGAAVRLEIIETEIAWLAALFMPLFGSINMFVDEMRKPFMFLVPGSPGARLLAGALPSVLDGVSAAVLVTIILALMGAVPLTQAAGLMLLGTTIALLAQGSVALVQTVIPYWVGYRTRMSITVGVTGVTFSPSLVVLIASYILINPTVALLACAGVTALAGAVLLAIAAISFDHVEFSG